ncbi:MAG: type I 3-dehydroquinate dehydratase [Acidobacteria bacterium]|nr:type I 3-dehydroquinate dehydratase [Acidobacteriota bacterium]
MSHSLLCETVTGTTMAELIAARDAATASDLVELRLDGVDDLQVAGALPGRQRPTIVTCRPVWEGGRFEGDEESRLRLLSEALELGAEYVDVEWRAVRDTARFPGFEALMRAGGDRVIVSSHDFDAMPQDLAVRAHAMRRSGARMIKIAATPARLTDTLALRDIAREGGAVVIGMGNTGLSTRLLATRFGSRWTYGGNGVAPGQIPPARMLRQYRFKSIDDATSLYGVVGKSAARALSPVLHNAAFAAAGLNAVCVPLHTADVHDFLAFADALNFSGASLDESVERDATATSMQSDELARRAGKADMARRTGSSWESSYLGLTSAGGELTQVAGSDAIAAQVAVAERQFEWWTGQRPVSGVMRAAAELEQASNPI